MHRVGVPYGGPALKRPFSYYLWTRYLLVQLNGFQYEKAFKGLFVGYHLIIMHLKCKKVSFCEKGLKKALQKGFKRPFSYYLWTRYLVIQLNGFQHEKGFKGLFVEYRMFIIHLKCKKSVL